MRRKLVVLNVLFILMLILSACGPKEEPVVDTPDDGGASTEGEGTPLEEVTLTWYVVGKGTPPEADLVMEAINDLPQMKAINTKINIVWYNWGSYNEKTQLMFAAGEECDMTFTSSWTNNYTNGSIEGNFVPLDDLLPEYAPQLWAMIPDPAWNMTRVGGNIYGVPVQQLWYSAWGPVIRKDYADLYGLNLDEVDEYVDLEPFMQAILDAEPELENKIFVKPGGITHVETYGYESAGPGVIMKGDMDRQIVDWVATDAYREGVELMYKWHEMGFTPNEVLSSDDVHTGRVADFYPIWDHVAKPGVDAEEGNKFNLEYVYKSLQFQPSLTYILPGLNGVCSTSKNPERAVMFMELMHTDQELFNMVAKGIEGKHWVWVDKSKQIVGPPEGVTSETNGYAPNTDWEWSNNFLAYYISEAQVGAWDLTKEVNQSSPLPMAGPWSFDPTPVEADVAALATIDEQYNNLLIWGLVDPDDPELGIQAYIDARKAAGLDAIIAEAQAQLDQFVADNPEIFE